MSARLESEKQSVDSAVAIAPACTPPTLDILPSGGEREAGASLPVTYELRRDSSAAMSQIDNTDLIPRHPLQPA